MIEIEQKLWKLQVLILKLKFWWRFRIRKPNWITIPVLKNWDD